MNRLRQILKDRRGVAFPLIIAIVLVLVPSLRTTLFRAGPWTVTG